VFRIKSSARHPADWPPMTLARGTDRIDSERLVLRRITQEDLGFLIRIHADLDVSRYLGHGQRRSPRESFAWLQSTLGTYENFDLGQLAVLRKSDGALIGRCGLSDLAVEASASTGAHPRAWYQRAQAPDDIELLFERELGYTFERSSWGNGYASEAARCVFDYACDALKLRRVVSIIHPENVRSLRVAQRFGLQREDTVEVMGHPRDRYVWPIQC
jgi:[ribosomal protein S5]-alanine N-acetyltransferase